MTLPRRVLVTADAVGGVWTHALELAAGLADRGVRTTLAVLGPGPDAAQRARAAALVPTLELVATGLDLEWRDRAGPLAPEARRRLLAVEAACRPDLVHVNGFREAAAGFAAPVLLAAHSCVRTWWRACRGGDPPPEWDAYARGVREGLAAAGALAAPTRAFLDEFRAAWGEPSPPVARAVPNGLGPGPFPGVERRPAILAAGRLWDEAKGAAALARVAPRLPWPVLAAGEAGPDGIGDGDGRPGEGEGLRHLGRLAPDELRAAMAAAEIFAAPSRYEPFGLAALEAAAAGCALVLGDLPSLREVWGDAAAYVPPGDDEALLATLLGLIGDGRARRRLRRAALGRARRHARARMADGYLALYAGLLGGVDAGARAGRRAA